MKLSNTMMINEKLLPASKKAFTLAEVLITLSILGVVAALTIPTLVNRQSDLAAQTRIKKAISAYEDMAAIYMAENDAANLKALPCADLDDYFKQVNQVNTGAGTCGFTTADGVLWVFGDTAQQNGGEDTGNRGNALVYDSATSPRYAAVLWSKAGEANGTGANNGNVNRTPVAAEIPAAPAANVVAAPLHGYFNASTFLNTSAGDLQNAQAAAHAYASAIPARNP